MDGTLLFSLYCFFVFVAPCIIITFGWYCWLFFKEARLTFVSTHFYASCPSVDRARSPLNANVSADLTDFCLGSLRAMNPFPVQDPCRRMIPSSLSCRQRQTLRPYERKAAQRRGCNLPRPWKVSPPLSPSGAGGLSHCSCGHHSL